MERDFNIGWWSTRAAPWISSVCFFFPQPEVQPSLGRISTFKHFSREMTPNRVCFPPPAVLPAGPLTNRGGVAAPSHIAGSAGSLCSLRSPDSLYRLVGNSRIVGYTPADESQFAAPANSQAIPYRPQAFASAGRQSRFRRLSLKCTPVEE